MFLQIQGLRVSYMTSNIFTEIIRGVDMGIGEGECVGLVGESGCGKTTIGLSITKLIPKNKGVISSGRILLKGQDILKLEGDELRKTRGKRISYVFQEPSSSLNPVFTIYEQLKESLPEAGDVDKYISEILNGVGLAKIAGKKKIYPHELSGGMQQRVMIAMAIASKPELVIMDEPTSSLDVSSQRHIMELIRELKNRMNLSLLFISHDLRIIFDISDRIDVMYAGIIVEEGPRDKVFSTPLHPYTKGLIDSIPSLAHRKKRFNAIDGKMPLFSDLPAGCKFYPRCKFRRDRCMEKEPDLEEIFEGRFSRCIMAEEMGSKGWNY